MSDDGWRTMYFGKPYIYSLLAAPWARLFGANGMLAWNMLLLVGMIVMGAQYLARYNSPGRALLFACVFFLLSTAFGYAFWLQPEVFNMAAVTACLFFGFRSLDGTADGSAGRPALAALLSAGALALGTYNKPVIALVGVPILVAYLARRQWRLRRGLDRQRRRRDGGPGRNRLDADRARLVLPRGRPPRRDAVRAGPLAGGPGRAGRAAPAAPPVAAAAAPTSAPAQSIVEHAGFRVDPQVEAEPTDGAVPARRGAAAGASRSRQQRLVLDLPGAADHVRRVPREPAVLLRRAAIPGSSSTFPSP